MTDIRTNVVRWAHHVVPRSAVAAEAYSSLMLGRASVALGAGARARALSHLMRAWRISPPGRIFGGAARHWARRMIRGATRSPGGELVPLRENRILGDWVNSPEAVRIRSRYARFPLEHRVRLRLPLAVEDPARQGDLIILKPPLPGGEKGALLIKYSETIEYFAAVFRTEHLAERYAFVLEPSSWGYPELRFVLFIGADARVVVQAPVPGDREFIDSLHSNLHAVGIGAGDWVDADAFHPPADPARTWDVALVASWSRVKRHRVLFEALAELRGRGVRLTAVLVGYPSDLSRADIEEQARRHGVHDQCTFFEDVPHEKVNEIVGRSRVSLLLSRQEGASKVIYESLFAGTPILVPEGHLGVNLEHAASVGGLFRDETLAAELERIAGGAVREGVRDWALQHTGAARSTRAINAVLRELAERAGEPWTRDIVGKRNAPALEYLERDRHKEFDVHYTALAPYLR